MQPMIVLNGKEVAEKLNDALKDSVAEFTKARGHAPGLAVVLVGEDPASQVYVRNKVRTCDLLGIRSFEKRLPADTPEEHLKKVIVELNNSPEVSGILVQLPLPKHLNEDKILSFIKPEKDPDCLTIENQGLLLAGRARVHPCTPKGVMEILRYYDIPIAGKKAVVVGRSQIVGKPMALLLQESDATVTVCHSRTPNTSEYTRQADIVVVAAGKKRLLGKEDFKKGSVVIDVGIHRESDDSGNSKLCGDVRFEELDGWVYAATPVPRGVGPMTIAMLMVNTLNLAQMSYHTH